MKNHFPTCYVYSVKKPIGELNLKRALDENTGVFSFFFSFLSSSESSPLGQTAVSGNSMHPSLVILGVFKFVFFFIFILIFCESLALYAKSRSLIYTILPPNKVLTMMKFNFMQGM